MKELVFILINNVEFHLLYVVVKIICKLEHTKLCIKKVSDGNENANLIVWRARRPANGKSVSMGWVGCESAIGYRLLGSEDMFSGRINAHAVVSCMMNSKLATLPVVESLAAAGFVYKLYVVLGYDQPVVNPGIISLY